ncbi:hypothetical protein Scep_009581 [Stephania cephalantha]|uniref:Uncharacterized protein n=1 Tax=Stephania cephalantha TaxID=152367 RepID=A0AAP0PGC0_9MAGN
MALSEGTPAKKASKRLQTATLIPKVEKSIARTTAKRSSSWLKRMKRHVASNCDDEGSGGGAAEADGKGFTRGRRARPCRNGKVDIAYILFVENGFPPPSAYEYEVVLKYTINIIGEKSLDKMSYVKVDGKWVSTTMSQEVKSKKRMKAEIKGVVLMSLARKEMDPYDSNEEMDAEMEGIDGSTTYHFHKHGEEFHLIDTSPTNELNPTAIRGSASASIRGSASGLIIQDSMEENMGGVVIQGEGFRGRSAGSQGAILGEQHNLKNVSTMFVAHHKFMEEDFEEVKLVTQQSSMYLKKELSTMTVSECTTINEELGKLFANSM